MRFQSKNSRARWQALGFALAMLPILVPDLPSQRLKSRVPQPATAAPQAARGLLTFALYDLNINGYKSIGTTITLLPVNLKVDVMWVPPKGDTQEWQWQVAEQPFPADPSQPPKALRGMGKAKSGHFTIDFATFPPLGKARQTNAAVAKVGNITTAPPASTSGSRSQFKLPQGDGSRDFYIRLVPIGPGRGAKLPSNTIIAEYRPSKLPTSVTKITTPEDLAKQQAAKAESLRTHKLQIVGWELMVFEDPNRWGCVVIVSNPHYKKSAAMNPWALYEPGREVCPRIDPSTRQKGAVGWAWEGVKGWGKAWDGLVHSYDYAKSWVASQVASGVPCNMLGDMEDDCEAFARDVAATALEVGLVAAGIPPSLPDLTAVQQAAKGQIVDAAVTYTCETIEAQGGTCTPAMRDMLKKVYTAGFDQLQKQIAKSGSEPHCGDAAAAKLHGKLPLPCFTDHGITVKPAVGAVLEPMKVTVRVTRHRNDFPIDRDCRVTAGVWLKNTHPEVGPIEGNPFRPGIPVPLPPMKIGDSKTVTLVLGPPDMVSNKRFLSSDQPYGDWLSLYRGGQGTVGGGAGECAAGDSKNVSIPVDL